MLWILFMLSGCANTETPPAPVEPPAVEVQAAAPIESRTVQRPSVADSPIIVLDSAHQNEGRVAHPYTLAPVSSLRFDRGDVVFPDTELGPTNAVHIMLGRGLLYRMKLPDEGLIVLDQSTLEPLKGSPDFTGFEAPYEMMVAFGHDAFAAQPVPHFKTSWLTTVKFEALIP